MITVVDNYRSFDISFDSNDEQFYAISNKYDTDCKSKSFAAVKGKIDEYIKTNATFHPFQIFNKSGEIQKVVGIRKDKKFWIEKNGSRSQLSNYSEKDWFIYSPEVDEILAKRKEIGRKISELYKEQDQLNFLGYKTVRDIKPDYITE